VTLSHLLGYLLKRYKMATYALIIGFITGSLGVVWPWKETIYRTGPDGNFLTDSTGAKIVASFERYFPDFGNWQSWLAVFFMLLGIMAVAGLELYGKRLERKNG